MATILAASWSVAAKADDAAADSTAQRDRTPRAETKRSNAPAAGADSLTPGTRLPRVVRLAELLVRGARIHDPLSSETVHLIPSSIVRTLPVDRVTDLIALQSGVVARGEDLHVRGGRAGESRVVLHGITLNDPLRGRPMELPLVALRDAELASGGLDADEGGALAGVLRLRTMEPGERWNGEMQWHTDARTSTHYDRVAARLGGPVAATGFGAVASVEATLDDSYLPNLRTNTRHKTLGQSFGWRADNRLLAHAKIATHPAASRWTLEALGNRRVDRPSDPAWSLDGYTSPCSTPENPDFCFQPGFSDTVRFGYSRYRAADHTPITDDRRAMAALSWERLGVGQLLGVTLGWLGGRSITSLDGHDDASYLVEERYPMYGIEDSFVSDPFHAYVGDVPYFRKASSSRWTLRVDDRETTSRGDIFKLGAGVTYDAVSLRQMDFSTPGFQLDSIRTYHAFAPGAWAYGHVRWVFEGLVANGGLRGEYFTAGPQSDDQSFPSDPRGVWTLSPRLGVAYPISATDAFSLSYVRVQQNPDRDYLYDDRLRITNRQPIGNPTIEPATAISYQAAVKHLFSKDWSMQGAVFFRDIFGLVGARNRQLRTATPRLKYEDADDAHGSGTEWSLLWSGSNGSHAELHYTFLEARGTQSREEGVPFGPKLQAHPNSIGQHALDWDRRHTVSFATHLRHKRLGSVSWSTILGSGLPWSPHPKREEEADLSNENTRRFDWHEESSAAFRWTVPRYATGLTVGADVRNVFDSRWDQRATVDGYPNPKINTYYDDYPGGHPKSSTCGHPKLLHLS